MRSVADIVVSGQTFPALKKLWLFGMQQEEDILDEQQFLACTFSERHYTEPAVRVNE